MATSESARDDARVLIRDGADAAGVAATPLSMTALESRRARSARRGDTWKGMAFSGLGDCAATVSGPTR
jgi:hypothetical protein